MIQVRWTGAAGLEFSYAEQTLLVDPYFTRPGLGRVVFGRLCPDRDLVEKHLLSMKPVRALVVSHTHFDHALDIPVVAGHVEGPVLGSDSLYNLMAAQDLGHRVNVCSPGEHITVDDHLNITMLPSVHGRVILGRVPYPGNIEREIQLPLKASGYRVGQVFAPKIQIHGRVFLHLGSAGFVEDALDGQTCDVLFLCVPGWARMPGYPERVIEKTRPETVVLFHHDNFFKPLNINRRAASLGFIGMNQLKERIRGAFPQVRLQCPAVFETMGF